MFNCENANNMSDYVISYICLLVLSMVMLVFVNENLKRKMEHQKIRCPVGVFYGML